MKVKDLIVELKKKDPEDEVIIHLGDVNKAESDFFTPVGVGSSAGIFNSKSRGFRFVGRHDKDAVHLTIFDLDTL
jgi:hypothetical protein